LEWFPCHPSGYRAQKARPLNCYPLAASLVSVRFVIALALFNMTSVRAGRVLITLYALHLGATPIDIGFLAASFSVIPIFLSWQSGRWTDRFGARWLVMFGVAGSACGLMLPYFAPGLPAIFAAGVLSGLSMTFSNVSLQNLVGLLSAPGERARNFSNYTLAGSVCAFAGPLIAGFSIDHLGHARTCLVVIALASVPISMLLVSGGALPRGSRHAHPAGNPWHALTAPGVWPVLVVSSVAQVAADLFQFYMPVYAHDAGLSASAIGVVLAAYSAATFVARTFLPRVLMPSNEEKVLSHAFILSGLAFVLVPFVHSAGLLALISFLIGLGMGCSAPITLMLMFARSPEGRSGEAMGLRQTADNLTRLFSPALVGVLAAAAGIAAVFWLSAVTLAAGGLFARRRALGSGQD
jgi:MFS family permease